MTWLRTPPFSLRQLQYAVAVAETGGFGAAATLCAVSQPSLSAQVAKLEDALGVQLFERSARGASVTRAGEGLLRSFRSTLDAAQAVHTAAQRWAHPERILLRVGVIPTLAPYVLPGLAARLAVELPQVQVHWVEAQTAVCEARLAEGTLDAVLIADLPTIGGAVAEAVAWDPFLLVVPEDDARQGPVQLEDVAADALLLLEDGHCLREHAMALCMAPGAAESPYRATSLPTLVQMVGAGLGVSVVPASAVAVEVPRARVRVLPFSSDTVGRTVRMVWRAGHPDADTLASVTEVARQAWRASA